MKRAITLVLAVFFVCSTPLKGEHTVQIQLNLCCPDSTEFEAFMATIPEDTAEQLSYEEFKQQMMAGMESLSALIQSGKVYSAFCSINPKD